MKPITGRIKVEGCTVLFECGPVDPEVLGKLDEKPREGQPLGVVSKRYCALAFDRVFVRGTDKNGSTTSSIEWPIPAMARAYADAVLQSLRAVNARLATPDASDGWEVV